MYRKWTRFSLGLVAVLCVISVPKPLLGQGNWTWNRTEQWQRAYARTSATVTGGGNPAVQDLDTQDTGLMSGDEVQAACESDVNISGSGWSGHGNAVSTTIATLNPNNQAVLQWAFNEDHSAYLSSDRATFVAAGGGTEADVKVVASLVDNSGSGQTTTGSLRVDIGWTGPGLSGLSNQIDMQIQFGSASISLYRNDYSRHLVAAGVDGFGQYYSKSSNASMDSPIGSFGIGPGEFTAPLQNGSVARIHRRPPNQNQPATTTSAGAVFMMGGTGSGSGGEAYVGTIEIWAN